MWTIQVLYFDIMGTQTADWLEKLICRERIVTVKLHNVMQSFSLIKYHVETDVESEIAGFSVKKKTAARKCICLFVLL